MYIGSTLPLPHSSIYVLLLSVEAAYCTHGGNMYLDSSGKYENISLTSQKSLESLSGSAKRLFSIAGKGFIPI